MLISQLSEASKQNIKKKCLFLWALGKLFEIRKKKEDILLNFVLLQLKRRIFLEKY